MSPPSSSPTTGPRPKSSKREFTTFLRGLFKPSSKKPAGASAPTIQAPRQDIEITAEEHDSQPRASLNDGQATDGPTLHSSVMSGAPSLQVPGDVPANVVSAQEDAAPRQFCIRIKRSRYFVSLALMYTPISFETAIQQAIKRKESARSLWHGFKVVAKTAEGCVDGTPFKAPIAALNKLIAIADAVIDNKESVAALLLPIGQRLEVVSKEMGKELPRDLNLNCERFASTLKGATEELQKIHEQGLLKRMLELQENPKEIQDIIRQVDEVTKNFQAGLVPNLASSSS
ncbi:hypothetical protein FB451DRAFT_1446705 [Mycena latifolia]|nr:hypothetical protein FB451DRAFT_1446705 [Mycena latifolia]